MNQAGFAPIVAQPRRWDVLSSFMLQQGYKTFVEIGCKEGRTTGHILKTVPDSRVIAVDPWMADPAPSNGDATREDYKDWNFTKIEEEFWQNVGDAKDRCKHFRMTSEHMGNSWEEWSPLGWKYDDPTDRGATKANQADIVFIDALHDYEAVKQDIAAWWPKVRIGGCLAFHDFNHKWPGVERAIADSFNLMQIGIASDSVAFILKHSEEQLRAA